jgi:hypothetical protein
LRLLEAFHAAVREVYERVQTEAERTIARVEALLEQSQKRNTISRDDGALEALPPHEAALLRRRVSLLRALNSARTMLRQGDVEAMRRLAQAAEGLATHEREVSWRLVALVIRFWLTHSIERQGDLLIPPLIEAKEQALVAQDRLATLRIMRLLGLAYLNAGQLQLVE